MGVKRRLYKEAKGQQTTVCRPSVSNILCFHYKRSTFYTALQQLRPVMWLYNFQYKH